MFREIDPRFNSIFNETLAVYCPYLMKPDFDSAEYARLAAHAVETEYANNFFLHFAHDLGMVRYTADISRPRPVIF